jgi:hypothetical protein
MMGIAAAIPLETAVLKFRWRNNGYQMSRVF